MRELEKSLYPTTIESLRIILNFKKDKQNDFLISSSIHL